VEIRSFPRLPRARAGEFQSVRGGGDLAGRGFQRKGRRTQRSKPNTRQGLSLWALSVGSLPFLRERFCPENPWGHYLIVLVCCTVAHRSGHMAPWSLVRP
jgi:hypothetical protein